MPLTSATPRRLLTTAFALLVPLLFGCNPDVPLNPSFPVTVEAAKQDLNRMKEAPQPLPRPVLVAGGFADPGLVTGSLAKRIKRATGPETKVIPVSFFLTSSFDTCRAQMLRALQHACPSDDPLATVEVDVVGFSMGGLVARYAALPRDDGSRQLRINRLYTIASPHRGADMADLPTLDGRVRDMRAGTDFLAQLDAALPDVDYEIYSYVRLGDAIVGAENAAVPGDGVWWVQNKALEGAHLSAWRDPRILADIARRLRGEEPFTVSPPAPFPLPNDEAQTTATKVAGTP